MEPYLSQGDKKQTSVPGIKPDLDSSSVFSPDGTDVSGIMEQIEAEARKLDEAKLASQARLALPLAASVSTPKEAGDLNYLHRLVALLLACGAQVSDIGFELGITLEQVDLFQRNLLIEEQVKLYKTRFWDDSGQERLKAMMPQALGFIDDVMTGRIQGLDISKKLEMVKWVVEKVTGKATQQLDVNASVNFGHVLDEMKKMASSRAQIEGGAEHSSKSSHDVIDVTPPKDEMADWVTQWQKDQNAQ